MNINTPNVPPENNQKIKNGRQLRPGSAKK